MQDIEEVNLFQNWVRKESQNPMTFEFGPGLQINEDESKSCSRPGQPTNQIQMV